MATSVFGIDPDISSRMVLRNLNRTTAVGPIARDLLSPDEKVIRILDEMENGFRVDSTKLKELKSVYEDELLYLQNEIEKNFGQRLRLNSNKELGELFFGQLNLPPLRKTQKYSDSVSISVLERLSESFGSSHPFLRPLVEFKRIQPISKSIKTVFKKLDGSGRIHPEFNPFGCPTGRIYSYIQNLPRQVRSALIPDNEGNVFIQLDWSQQELRILGALSGEPVLLDCFANNEDLHKRVISEMFHKSISEVTDEERKLGKTINFGLIYGQEAPGLAWNLNISPEKAQELIDRYFSALPLIKRFKEESEAKFWKFGYAETAFGRRTLLNLKSSNINKELRRGFNHQIQGTGADLFRFTLVRLREGLEGKPGRLKFCAHDSIYLECPRDASQEMGELAKSIMEIDFKGVRLPVTLKTHHDFSMAKEIPIRISSPLYKGRRIYCPRRRILLGKSDFHTLRRRKAMKKFYELLQECKEKGIPIPEGQKLSRDYLIRRLAEHHLSHPSEGFPPLEQISPQLAKDIQDVSDEEREDVLKSDRYACGEKVNGVRGIFHIRPEGIRITSRNRCSDTYLLNELTENLPHLCSLDLKSWEESIFDGELYLKDAFIDLGSKANALEATAAILHCDSHKAKEFQGQNGKIRYHIFDVIKAKGENLVSMPLKERLKYLQAFKSSVQSMGYGDRIGFEELIFANKDQYLKKIIETGGEGIVLKDLEAPYSLGARPRSWLKIKRNSTVDAIIIGFARGKEWDKKGLIGSVELGVFDECGHLRSMGRVCSFPLQKRIQMTGLIDGTPSLKREFLGTVVECSFHELNKNLKGRHLQIVGFRNGADLKPISECCLDFSKDKERLIRAGMPIPPPVPESIFTSAYFAKP